MKYKRAILATALLAAPGIGILMLGSGNEPEKTRAYPKSKTTRTYLESGSYTKRQEGQQKEPATRAFSKSLDDLVEERFGIFLRDLEVHETENGFKEHYRTLIDLARGYEFGYIVSYLEKHPEEKDAMQKEFPNEYALAYSMRNSNKSIGDLQTENLNFVLKKLWQESEELVEQYRKDHRAENLFANKDAINKISKSGINPLEFFTVIGADYFLRHSSKVPESFQENLKKYFEVYSRIYSGSASEEDFETHDVLEGKIRSDLTKYSISLAEKNYEVLERLKRISPLDAFAYRFMGYEDPDMLPIKKRKKKN